MNEQNQNKNKVTSYSNWPLALLFDLAHKQCIGITKEWPHCLTSESKGRFLVNNILLAWCLLMVHPLPHPPSPSKWTSYVYHPLKINWLTSLPNIFNKGVTWLKIIKWAVKLFYVRVVYTCTTRFKSLRYNSVWKLLTVFPVNDIPVYLITRFFILDVKGLLDSPLDTIH